MANMAGGGGGRTGPYWRRQLGTTLPGERTGAELNIINMLRAKQGLDPEGGPIGDNTRVPVPGRPMVRPRVQLRGAQQGSNVQGLRDALHQAILRHAQPGPDLRGQFQQDVAENPPGRQALPPDFEGQLPGPDDPALGGAVGGLIPLPQVHHGPGDVRARLMNSLEGLGQPATSHAALRRYVEQSQGRQARPVRPILPPRAPLRQAKQAY